MTHTTLGTILAALLLASVAWAGPLDGVKLCLDPGHPSENGNGATGPSGVKEYKINWIIGQRLKQLLEEAGATVVLTKTSEGQTVTNRRRAEIANEAEVDLAVRLHCDSGGSSGFAFYYPDRQGTVQGVTGPSQAVREASEAAARGLYPMMKEKLTGYLPGRGIHGDSETYIGSRQGALTGSIFSKVPVLTIEMCMLTKASDEEFISSSSGQWKMAGSIKAGIVDYLGHEEEAPAEEAVAAGTLAPPVASAPPPTAAPAWPLPAPAAPALTPPPPAPTGPTGWEQSVGFLKWWVPAVVGAWALATGVWLALRQRRSAPPQRPMISR